MSKLINIRTKEEIKIGDRVQTGKGQFATLLSFTPPHKPASTGRVYIEEEENGWKHEYFPSIFGAKFIWF